MSIRSLTNSDSSSSISDDEVKSYKSDKSDELDGKFLPRFAGFTGGQNEIKFDHKTVELAQMYDDMEKKLILPIKNETINLTLNLFGRKMPAHQAQLGEIMGRDGDCNSSGHNAICIMKEIAHDWNKCLDVLSKEDPSARDDLFSYFQNIGIETGFDLRDRHLEFNIIDDKQNHMKDLVASIQHLEVDSNPITFEKDYIEAINPDCDLALYMTENESYKNINLVDKIFDSQTIGESRRGFALVNSDGQFYVIMQLNDTHAIIINSHKSSMCLISKDELERIIQEEDSFTLEGMYNIILQEVSEFQFGTILVEDGSYNESIQEIASKIFVSPDKSESDKREAKLDKLKAKLDKWKAKSDKWKAVYDKSKAELDECEAKLDKLKAESEKRKVALDRYVDASAERKFAYDRYVDALDRYVAASEKRKVAYDRYVDASEKRKAVSDRFISDVEYKNKRELSEDEKSSRYSDSSSKSNFLVDEMDLRKPAENKSKSPISSPKKDKSCSIM